MNRRQFLMSSAAAITAPALASKIPQTGFMPNYHGLDFGGPDETIIFEFVLTKGQAQMLAKHRLIKEFNANAFHT